MVARRMPCRALGSGVIGKRKDPLREHFFKGAKVAKLSNLIRNS